MKENKDRENTNALVGETLIFWDEMFFANVDASDDDDVLHGWSFYIN